MMNTGETAAAAAAATTEMEPWEQHHKVINMPRFAYDPASVLQQHNAGFLITCAFRREKSATKEVLALLQEYMDLTGEVSKGNPKSNPTYHGSGTRQSDKQPEEEGIEYSHGSVLSSKDSTAISCPTRESCGSFKKPTMSNESGIDVDDFTGKDCGIVPEKGKADIRRDKEGEGAGLLLGPVNALDDLISNESGHEFILIKLATMGVIYICISGKPPSSVLNVASRILKDVQAGTRAAPQWCHRMLPVQATCSMKREELQAVVSQLVKDHLRSHGSPTEELVNYAVAFNRRGGGVVTSCPTDSPETAVLNRDECIKIVTSAVEQVTTSVKVNLISPQMVVVVELIPVAGVQSSLMCALSVLPGDLILSKPKLNVKPLAPLNPKSKKRKYVR